MDKISPANSEASWIQLESDARLAREQRERMAIASMTLAHDVRQRLHVLLNTPSIVGRSSNSRDTTSTQVSMRESLLRLAKKCEQVAALASVSGMDGILAPKSSVAIRSVFEDVYFDWYAEAESKGLRLKIRSPNVVVSSNAFWLGVIVGNLVANAVQHTKVGEVTVDVTPNDSDWLLTISDNGPGIDLATLRTSWRDIGRLRAGDGGMGLGLFLVREVSRLLGHVLSISSSHLGTSVRLEIEGESDRSVNVFQPTEPVESNISRRSEHRHGASSEGADA